MPDCYEWLVSPHQWFDPLVSKSKQESKDIVILKPPAFVSGADTLMMPFCLEEGKKEAF